MGYSFFTKDAVGSNKLYPFRGPILYLRINYTNYIVNHQFFRLFTYKIYTEKNKNQLGTMDRTIDLLEKQSPL
jgi:hypothetical protein